MTAALSRETRLPRPLTRLIGRDAERREIAGLLRDERIRLLTVTGPGGVGKTRLAVAVAADLGDAFRDGIVFVDLAPRSRSPLRSCPAVAAALELTDQGSIPLVEAVRRRLSTRQMLLVLDNFEHLLPAAPLVSELLQAAPEVQALVTSRAALRLHGEREYPVSPLPLPDPGAMLVPEELSDVGGDPAVCRSGHVTRNPVSASRMTMPLMWWRSASGSTGCRWPSSWPRHGSSC